MTKQEFIYNIVIRWGYVNVDHTIYINKMSIYDRILVTDTLAVRQIEGFGAWVDKEVYFYDEWFVNAGGIIEHKND